MLSYKAKKKLFVPTPVFWTVRNGYLLFDDDCDVIMRIRVRMRVRIRMRMRVSMKMAETTMTSQTQSF